MVEFLRFSRGPVDNTTSLNNTLSHVYKMSMGNAAHNFTFGKRTRV